MEKYLPFPNSLKVDKRMLKIMLRNVMTFFCPFFVVCLHFTVCCKRFIDVAFARTCVHLNVRV
jgi:hypothetical protein